MTVTAMKISYITNYYSSNPETSNKIIVLTKQIAYSVDKQLM